MRNYIVYAILLLLIILPSCGGSDVPEEYCSFHSCYSVPSTGQDMDFFSESYLSSCPSKVGSETCADVPYCGQDAQYKDAERSFECYDSSGSKRDCSDILPPSDNEVVKDTLTGLIWQRTNWEDSDTFSWQEAENYCNITLNEGSGYGGYTNWRLPNPYELLGLVDNSNHTVITADDAAFHDLLVHGILWSQSYKLNSDRAWTIGMDLGDISDEYKNPASGSYFMCVCDSKKFTETVNDFPRFTELDVTNEIVIEDHETGLTWHKDYTSGIWAEALSYCESSNYAGYSDWRLPNKNELASLVNFAKSNPASDFPDMPLEVFWSSTTAHNNVDRGWVTDFTDGRVNSAYAKSGKLFVRCVRDGDL